MEGSKPKFAIGDVAFALEHAGDYPVAAYPVRISDIRLDAPGKFSYGCLYHPRGGEDFKPSIYAILLAQDGRYLAEDYHKAIFHEGSYPIERVGLPSPLLLTVEEYCEHWETLSSSKRQSNLPELVGLGEAYSPGQWLWSHKLQRKVQILRSCLREKAGVLQYWYKLSGDDTFYHPHSSLQPMREALVPGAREGVEASEDHASLLKQLERVESLRDHAISVFDTEIAKLREELEKQ